MSHLLRCEEPGYQQIYAHDRRRGVWLRVVVDAQSMTTIRLDLCAGREGDDHFATLEVGEVVTTQQLEKLAMVITYGKDAFASFTPPVGICADCGKSTTISGASGDVPLALEAANATPGSNPLICDEIKTMAT